MAHKVINLCGCMSPRATMNVTPKVKRSIEEWERLKTNTEKAMKRNKTNG